MEKGKQGRGDRSDGTEWRAHLAVGSEKSRDIDQRHLLLGIEDHGRAGQQRRSAIWSVRERRREPLEEELRLGDVVGLGTECLAHILNRVAEGH